MYQAGVFDGGARKEGHECKAQALLLEYDDEGWGGGVHVSVVYASWDAKMDVKDK